MDKHQQLVHDTEAAIKRLRRRHIKHNDHDGAHKEPDPECNHAADLLEKWMKEYE